MKGSDGGFAIFFFRDVVGISLRIKGAAGGFFFFSSFDLGYRRSDMDTWRFPPVTLTDKNKTGGWGHFSRHKTRFRLVH
jgi:hypothetical protein